MEILDAPYLGRRVLDLVLKQVRVVSSLCDKEPIVEGTVFYNKMPVTWTYAALGTGTASLEFSFTQRGIRKRQRVRIEMSSGQVISRSQWRSERRRMSHGPRRG